jgi:hypothetical protein
VSRPVATEIRKIHGIAHPAFPARIDGVADLFDAARHSIALSYVGEHLRHERQALEGAVAVQRGENFGGGPDFDEVTQSQRPAICDSIGLHKSPLGSADGHTVQITIKPVSLRSRAYEQTYDSKQIVTKRRWWLAEGDLLLFAYETGYQKPKLTHSGMLAIPNRQEALEPICEIY